MPDAQASIRVATWNIHRAVGSDGRSDPDRIIEVLREISADVVALQEVAYRSADGGNALEAFAEATGTEPVKGITLHDERGHYGNAVLTRLPVLGLHRHDISVAGREPRGAIDLTLDCDVFELRLVVTHLGLSPAERRYQVRRLSQLFEPGTSGVELLLGDLNEWFIAGRPLRMLRRVFGPAPAPATFPARRPLVALDRIWARPAAALRHIAAHRSPLARRASDHLPLVADLVVAPR